MGLSVRMDCRIKFTAGPATSGRTRLSGNDEGKNEKIKGSGTPADALCLARTQAACGAHHGKAACAALRLRARSPAGVPPRFSPKGLSSPGLSIGPGFPKGGIKGRT